MSRYTGGLYAIRYGIHSGSPLCPLYLPPSFFPYTLHFQGHCSSRPRKSNPLALLQPEPPKSSVHARAEASGGYLFAGPVRVAVIRAGSCPWRRGEQHFILPTVCRTERRAQPRQPGDVTQRRVWEEIGAARRDHTNPSARAKLFIHLTARTQHIRANTRVTAPKSESFTASALQSALFLHSCTARALTQTSYHFFFFWYRNNHMFLTSFFFFSHMHALSLSFHVIDFYT